MLGEQTGGGARGYTGIGTAGLFPATLVSDSSSVQLPSGLVTSLKPSLPLGTSPCPDLFAIGMLSRPLVCHIHFIASPIPNQTNVVFSSLACSQTDITVPSSPRQAQELPALPPGSGLAASLSPAEPTPSVHPPHGEQHLHCCGDLRCPPDPHARLQRDQKSRPFFQSTHTFFPATSLTTNVLISPNLKKNYSTEHLFSIYPDP